jgi:3-hydroxyacyl-[acyl-carrier-protein] dehydratase
MVQIGLVVLGIHLIVTGANAGAADMANPTPGKDAVFPLLSSVNVEFHKMALPGQRLTVTSKKDYFRFDKLKCHVEMHDAAGELIAKGIFSGFLKKIETA